MKTKIARIVAAVGVVLACGCGATHVTVEPVEIKPIRMTIDVNVRIDRELDDFFDFEDAPEPPEPPLPRETEP